MIRPLVVGLVGLLLLFGAIGASAPAADIVNFRRGDTNADGVRDIADGVFLLDYLFVGGPPPSCRDAADANDDGNVDNGDAIWILSFLFIDAAPPPTPGGECGIDPTGDTLGCESYPACPVQDFDGFVLMLFDITGDGSDPVEINDFSFCFAEDPTAYDLLLDLP